MTISERTNGICYDTNDLRLYNKLPKYVQRRVTLCTMNKTLDGYHCMINFINKDGNEDFMDEYGISEFLGEIRFNRNIFE